MKTQLTPVEFALRHKLSLQGVYLKLRMRQLPAVKKDGRWFIEDSNYADRAKEENNAD